MATVLDLPHDILALVLTNLSLHTSLVTTDRVSKAFHEASKHPMLWDVNVVLDKNADLRLEQAVEYFTKHKCVPDGLVVRVEWMSCASLHMLSRTHMGSRITSTSLRSLELMCTAFEDQSAITKMLSSLKQLEIFHAELLHDSLEFPFMPCLKHLNLKGTEMQLINMDTEHLPNLLFLWIYCDDLQGSTFPDSLRKLALDFCACHDDVVCNVAQLPNLEIIDSIFIDDIFSQPDLRFTSTLTAFEWMAELGDEARENLRDMTNLTRLHVHTAHMTDEDVEIMACLPALTDLHVTHCGGHDDGFDDIVWSPLRDAPSLQRMRLESIPASSIPLFALPSLTYLELLECDANTSLAPLASCVNLAALRVDFDLSEPDAQVIAGLTNLEKLNVKVACEECFTHICKLPRLKVLAVWSLIPIGTTALQGLVGLAPTIEELALPDVVDTQAAVKAVSQLTRLTEFSTMAPLSDEQVSLLKRSLPRVVTVLCEQCSLDGGFTHFNYMF